MGWHVHLAVWDDTVFSEAFVDRRPMIGVVEDMSNAFACDELPATTQQESLMRHLVSLSG